ncbi:hypothetical protein BDR05DRAFT_973670 [Suillus weaverae]|nr:hypothetical protein BDR05DRAFT_973670 [Suillus weaverae]
MDIDAMLPPSGEEGFTVSHAGDELALYKELEKITMAQPRRVDTHDRSEHIAHQVADWASQYNDLTDARGSKIRITSVSPFLNVSLLHYGCIGSSLICPTTAMTIRTLNVYWQTQAKTLCALHNVYFHHHLAEQLRVAYVIYLELNRHINFCLDKFLACQYSLVDEPPLEFSFLCAYDGNNSAKLIDPAICSGKERPDPRSGMSSIWLTKSYVDQFKDEVRSAHVHQGQRWPASSDPDDPWIDEPDSNDSAEPPSVCVDRWRNAAPKSWKQMFATFKQSSTFVTVCRHGFCL